MDKATHELVNELWAEGRVPEATLAAAAMLDGNPSDLKAWHLLARLVAVAGRTLQASAALTSLARAYAGNGDLPMAIVAALECVDAGGKSRLLLDELARSYSAACRDLDDDWRPEPPAMPARVEVHLGEARSETLVRSAVDRALAKARKALKSKKNVRCRFYPLFSSLSRKAFSLFACELAVIRLKDGEIVVEQGEVGDSFYIVVQGEVHVSRKGSGDEEHLRLARLGSGAFFGEMSIVGRAPRAARVSTATDVTLLRADMEKLGSMSDEMSELRETLEAFCRARMLENVVLASSILRRVPVKERSDLLSRFEQRSQSKGDVIIERGSESDALFLLVSGEVEVTRTEEEEELTLARLGPGEYFGEISLVLQRPATADVTSMSDTLCLMLPRGAFREVIQDHPGLLAEAYETALKRQEETASILAREAESADDLILV